MATASSPAAAQAALPLIGGPALVAEVREARSQGAPKLQTVGLFAGIGGIELGLTGAGHEAQLLCEIMPAARTVLEDRFPGVAIQTDVTTLGSLPRGTQLLAAGFPCQDLSQAGRTAGIAGDQSSLVGQVFRLLERQRVPWVLLENVPFMLQLAGGRALDVIILELERLGYRWCYRVIDAQAFGRPQRRRRVYLLASQSDDPREVLFAGEAATAEHPRDALEDGKAYGFYWTEGVRGLGWAVECVPTLKGGSTIGIPSPPAIVLPGGAVVKPAIEDAERLQGFRAGWTSVVASEHRGTVRWKLVGNAVAVPAARWIGQQLAAPSEFIVPPSWKLGPGRRWPEAAWNVGHGRFGTSLGDWPIRAKQQPLSTFLKHPPAPLSSRATAGFLNRAAKGQLRFPPGFIETLERHLEERRAFDRRPS